jgi:hypothetical protein
MASDYFPTVIKYKRIVLALSFIIVAIFLYFLDSSLQKDAVYQTFHLEKIFWTFIETFLSLSILLIVYEAYIHKNFIDLVGRKVVEAQLLDSTIIEEFGDVKKHTGIKKLLCSVHGKSLGDTINSLHSKNDRFNNNKFKEDFTYDITLEPHDSLKDFFKAVFKIGFSCKLPNSNNLEIESAVVKDGFDFQRRYCSLIKNNKSIYRYILLTNQTIKLDDSLFKIIDFNVMLNGGDQIINYTCSYNMDGDDILRVLFKPRSKKDIYTIKKEKGNMCRFSLNIETIVDKNIQVFPIRLPFPVKNFNSSFTAVKGTEINSIDMVEFINATDNFNKSQSSATHIAQVQGKANGWIIPDSGLVYTWN